MESIRQLYRIGQGPSSSHAIGPATAATRSRQAVPEAVRFQMVLYGRFAATGRGHLTDRALAPAPVTIECCPDQMLTLHPNGMYFEAYGADGRQLADWEVYSVGGGALRDQEGPVAVQRSKSIRTREVGHQDLPPGARDNLLKLLQQNKKRKPASRRSGLFTELFGA